MPPPPHSKPENVLKRAHELIGVGQPTAALSIIHEHVTSKRTRGSPISSLEPVMLLFVDLCVDLKKGKLAKDGLYQYKNIAQNANINTIQLVFKKFIELAEAKVTEAQAKADEIQSTLDQTSDTTNVDDLEAIETPESILLSTVSGEQSKDRTDRAIVTPWLKFLWETYRTVLDIFKNNSRLEIMYQSTARQAFQFCSKFQRKTEFRRLCELLRNHLQNVAKFGAQMHAINLNDPDTLQRHLDTRFQQLNVAVELELWQEAFRSVEDIHTLLSLSKRPAKPIMMANYFEKLTRIFLVSENYLFHAAAWSRYYNLLRQSAGAVSQGGLKKDHPAVTESDMARAASFVLLAALSIPVISTSRSRGALIDVDEARKSKNVRLTNLLGMNQAPTRALLFRDAKTKGLLSRCRPEIRELYNILEVDFHPLSICKRISPILTQIASDPEMEKYIHPLQQVILTRLFQQLSQVYESVQLEFVIGLAQFPEPFQVNSATIEKFIMNGCKKGDLAIRIDHATGVLTFDSDVFSSAKALHPGSGAGSAEAPGGAVQHLQNTPAEIVRSQLRRLADSLFTAVQIVDPSFNAARHKQREVALERAKAGYDKERKSILARKEIIDRKKQAASSAAAQKEKDLQTQKRIKQQELLAAETQRLAEEQKERDRKRLEAERRKVQDEENARAIEELKRGTKGIDLKSIDMDALDSTKIRTIKIRALEKEKSELHDKLRVTGRRIDHLERAFRLEEVKHLPEDYAAQKELDLNAYETDKAELLRTSKEKHTEDVSLKHRLARLVPIYESFRDEIRTQRKADFEKRKRKAQQELESQMQARIRDYHERKAREKHEREEAERIRVEEEERAAQEAEERRQVEEEKSRRLAEEKAARDAQRRDLDEKARLQREREAAAEAKIAARRAGIGSGVGDSVPSRDLSGSARTPDDRPSERPRIALAPRTAGDSAPTWREREAAKKVAGGTEASLPVRSAEPERTRDNSEEPTRRTGGYVPPARRTEGASAEGSGYVPPSRRTESASAEGSGYVPPARRAAEGAGESRQGYVPPVRRTGGEAEGGGWRAREAAKREAPAARREDGTRAGGRDTLRPTRDFGARDTSTNAGSGRDESPLPLPSASGDGKYRPGMFKKNRDGGS